MDVEQYKLVYDKYGSEFKIDSSEIKTELKIKKLQFLAGMEMYIHYVIIGILVMILSGENGMGKLKTISCIVLGISFILDSYYYWADSLDKEHLI